MMLFCFQQSFSSRALLIVLHSYVHAVFNTARQESTPTQLLRESGFKCIHQPWRVMRIFSSSSEPHIRRCICRSLSKRP
ncbi:hypothetical protein EDB81DRAFT_775957 [Dactylonectria macrodidyma]|uniref:Secreted protein n=1 Tax=Dactylonectria macrodidyma TaxID=307937 RepID=A0A9P9JHA8_9HYPO|nr:hypothetical protein EDB81DRAFT_775957 [Dactylonectria macrodidyma]